tara:strand:+ start:449 stop:772 length:324 start_codon:yes stop_codon:yes gene_type:complete
MNNVSQDNFYWYGYMFKIHFAYIVYFLLVFTFQLGGLKILSLIWFVFYLFLTFRGFYRFFTSPKDNSEESHRYSNMSLNETFSGLFGSLMSGLGSYWLTFLVPGVWR